MNSRASIRTKPVESRRHKEKPACRCLGGLLRGLVDWGIEPKAVEPPSTEALRKTPSNSDPSYLCAFVVNSGDRWCEPEARKPGEARAGYPRHPRSRSGVCGRERERVVKSDTT